MARSRRAPAATAKPQVARKTRRTIQKKVSVPLVIKCESNLCEVLLSSLTSVNFDWSIWPIRIQKQWRNKTIKVPKVTGRKKAAKRVNPEGQRRAKQNQQRYRLRTATVHQPMCKPLLPNRLLLSLAQSKVTPGQGSTTSSTDRQRTALLEAIGAPIESFCPQPLPVAAQTSNATVMVATQRGLDGSIYSWNEEDNMGLQPDPNNIFNHIRNGLAECRLFGLMPFQEHQNIVPVPESSGIECNMLPQVAADPAGSTLDIFQHVRNLLSESPIGDASDASDVSSETASVNKYPTQ